MRFSVRTGKKDTTPLDSLAKTGNRMRGGFVHLVIWGLLAVFCLCSRVDATPPLTVGKAWRIAYIEGGEYVEYRDSLYGLLTAFHHLGLLPEAPGSDLSTSRQLWDWAAKQASPYLRFPEDAYYSADWQNHQRMTVCERLYTDLADGKADMVLGMGTWAGLDLARKNPGVPVVMMAVSDAVNAGLFQDDTPGNPRWLHVRMDPGRDKRGIRIFHDTIGFKTLGVVYRDSVEGRTYAALDSVREVARERNFKVQTCRMPDGEGSENEEALLLQCYTALSGKVDAFYITENTALTEETLSRLVDLTLKHRIPTFSQMGSKEVRAGILMSISQINFFRLGDFTAKTIMRIMEGEMPGALPMVLEDPPVIAVNMMTAKKIGIALPVDVLSASDQIFLHIQAFKEHTPRQDLAMEEVSK